ncbi:unnamed protein product [Mesocestoides corti]|uniref:J domain-containing protein n=1 Tax=Mesocestoides corti TaxID=53468 RepID=A0A0R3U2E2_MESCO|nr:unnamed protein product [Mesocestoides corti]
MNCTLKEDLHMEFPGQGEFEGTSEEAWHERLADELYSDLPRFDEYFEGFPDTDNLSGDYFEEVRREYERRKRQRYHATQPPADPAHSSEYTSASKDAEFRRRHAEGLKQRGLLTPSSSTIVLSPSYEQYSNEWRAFLKSGGGRAIPWPPITVGDTEGLLRFVKQSLVHLRQLQVDWHPDRFFARLPPDTERTKGLVDRVTALSQFLNATVSELKHRVGQKTA